jgi:hypothetical protein
LSTYVRRKERGVSYELEVAVMRAVFGEKAERWILVLETTLEASDEDKRGSITETHKQVSAQTKEFKQLNARKKEIGEEAEVIRKLIIGTNEVPALDAVLQVEDRVNALHDEAMKVDQESAWAFIQVMVSIRKLRKLLDDAMPGSAAGLEAQMKREAGLE